MCTYAYTHKRMYMYTNTHIQMHTLFHSLPLPCLGGHFQIAAGEYKDMSPECSPHFSSSLFSSLPSSLQTSFFLIIVCMGTRTLYEYVHVRQLCRVSPVFSPLRGSGG